ncbi:MAG: putative ATP-dependent serine protease [Bermanella sp.]|jgi:predicted ATP-dependent serine protease
MGRAFMLSILDNGYLESVTNPLTIFLERSRNPKPGSMVASLRESLRLLLAEIQALVIGSHQGTPEDWPLVLIKIT